MLLLLAVQRIDFYFTNKKGFCLVFKNCASVVERTKIFTYLII